MGVLLPLCSLLYELSLFCFPIKGSSRQIMLSTQRHYKQQRLESVVEGEHDGLVVQFMDYPKNRGLFATRVFEKDEPVVTYTGEVIDYKEGIRRYEQGISSEYLFKVRNREKPFWIDATADYEFGFGRFMNHENESNLACNVQPRMTDYGETTHCVFFALRKISAGEELCWDYKDDMNATLSFLGVFS